MSRSHQTNLKTYKTKNKRENVTWIFIQSFFKQKFDYSIRLSGFFDVMRRDDDRSTVFVTEAYQVVPNAEFAKEMGKK